MIHSISAFWNNAGDDGIGLQWQNGEPGSMEHLVKHINEAIAEWHADPPDVENLFQGLVDASAHKATLTNAQEVAVAITIGYLESIGELVSDNFNGLSFIRVAKPSIYQDGQHRHTSMH